MIDSGLFSQRMDPEEYYKRAFKDQAEKYEQELAMLRAQLAAKDLILDEIVKNMVKEMQLKVENRILHPEKGIVT